MTIKTNNFNEQTDPKLLCTCENLGCDKRSVSQSTLDRAQLVREDANRPLIVTSAGRCPNHPNEIHRDKPADHQLCQALDFFCHGGIERGQLVNLGIKHGFNAIGVASNFVHLGRREELPPGKIMMWVY
jgi:zinc D-Ala-D-Ala carboxypeptidase